MPRRCAIFRSSAWRSTKTMSASITPCERVTRSQSSRRSPEDSAMIRVQGEDFDVGVELERLAAGNHRIGGRATFLGVVVVMGGDKPPSPLPLAPSPASAQKKLSPTANPTPHPCPPSPPPCL